MKFRYVGNPRDLLDLHPQIMAFGLTFPLDEPVEVRDPRAIAKLKNNTHFELVRDDASGPETADTDPSGTIAPGEPSATSETPAAPAAARDPVARGGRRRA